MMGCHLIMSWQTIPQIEMASLLYAWSSLHQIVFTTQLSTHLTLAAFTKVKQPVKSKFFLISLSKVAYAAGETIENRVIVCFPHCG